MPLTDRHRALLWAAAGLLFGALTWLNLWYLLGPEDTCFDRGGQILSADAACRTASGEVVSLRSLVTPRLLLIDVGSALLVALPFWIVAGRLRFRRAKAAG